jgi:hypothetical protein
VITTFKADDGGAASKFARDLDGILDALSATVGEDGLLREVAGGDGVEEFSEFDHRVRCG